MSDEIENLKEKLHRFLEVAREEAPQLEGQSDEEAAQRMADMPEAREAAAMAAVAAEKTGYLKEENLRRLQRRFNAERSERLAGRSLGPQALHDLGIVGLLRSGEELDIDVLVSQLAGYLAGPPVPLQRLLVLSLDWELSGNLEIGGWRVWRPSREEWISMAPVPASSRHSNGFAWDPLLSFGEHVVLSIEDRSERPSKGFTLWPFASERHARSRAWVPLLAMSLWQDDPVGIFAEYLVENQRSVGTVFSSIPSRIVGVDLDHEIEVPQLGPFVVDEEESSAFFDYLGTISEMLDVWLAVSPAKKKAATTDRLQRCALRFLEASGYIGFGADVLYLEDQPQVLMLYVSALEHLLSARNEDSGDLRRRTAQRAAVLLGRDDAERVQINEVVSEAYGVRNKIAHGDEPNPEKLAYSVEHIRELIRWALLSVIALGPEISISSICDLALLNHASLQSNLTRPLSQLPRNSAGDYKPLSGC